MPPELENLQNLPFASWGLAGGIIIVVWKFLWPWLRTVTDSQIANSRTENALLNQALTERDKALQRADAAEARADELFKELSEIRAELRVMSFKLEYSEQQLAEVRAQLAKLLQERSE